MTPPRRPTVVIAEDDNVTREILRLILRDGGYDVIGEASNGEAAVGLCADLMPDIVCLDVMMPKLNGIDALKAIKAWDPDTVVLMITMDAAQETVSEALGNGASGYVLKPFNVGKILDTLARAWAKSGRKLRAG